MKHIIILIAALIAASSANLNTQDFHKEGNVYSKSTTVKQTKEEKTGFTWKDSKDIAYDIYIGPSGSCYIKRTSAKTDKEYKQYLGEEVSRDICKQLNREYKKN